MERIARKQIAPEVGRCIVDCMRNGYQTDTIMLSETEDPKTAESMMYHAVQTVKGFIEQRNGAKHAYVVGIPQEMAQRAEIDKAFFGLQMDAPEGTRIHYFEI